MTTLNSTIRALLVKGAIACNKVAADAAKVNEKRTGAYSLFVLAGIAAGNAETLTTVADALFSEIRQSGKVADDKGKSVQVATKRNEKGDAWVIPNALSSAKSTILSAFELGVDLGSESEPNPFSAIRTAVKVKRAEAEAAKDQHAKQRAEVLAALATIRETAEKADGETLARIADALIAALIVPAAETTETRKAA